MKSNIYIALIATAIMFTSCQDCKDCQATTSMNMVAEYYTLNAENNYELDSTLVFNIDTNTVLKDAANSINNFSLVNGILIYDNVFSPVSIYEFCGDDLSDVDNKTLNLDQVIYSAKLSEVPMQINAKFQFGVSDLALLPLLSSRC